MTLSSYFKSLVLYSMLSCCIFTVHARHFIGSDFSYQRSGVKPNGNIEFTVLLKLYRDCHQDVPVRSSVRIVVYQNDSARTYLTEFTFPLLGIRDVSPVQATTCNFDPNICIQEDTYYDFIDVPPSSAGYHIVYSDCCRSTQTNLDYRPDKAPYSNPGQTYYLFIPNTNIINSSPEFIGDPIPYICTGELTTISNFATDPDGDSLAYFLVAPFDSLHGDAMDPFPPNLPNPLRPVTYASGYSSMQPFGANGVATIGKGSGICIYKSAIDGRYAIAVEVHEYRNGQLINTVRRDLLIVSLTCPPNPAPQLSDATQQVDFSVPAAEQICFPILFTDADSMYLTKIGNIFTGDGGYKGPLATLEKINGEDIISTQFCWKPGCNEVRDTPYRFTVQVQDNGCPGKMTAVDYAIRVTPLEELTVQVLGPLTFCEGESTFLDAGEGYPNYLWSTGERTRTITVTQAGTYSVTVNGGPHCNAASDAVSVEVYPAPQVQIATSAGVSAICIEDDLVLSATPGFVSYLWSTGESTPDITILSPGLFSVTVTNEHTCSASTDVSISEILCGESYLYAPNAFSPNDDGVNDHFQIQHQLIKNYELSIFNRWGEKVFETDKVKNFWDGTIEGEDAQWGAYAYVIHAEGYDKKLYLLNGLVVVIR